MHSITHSFIYSFIHICFFVHSFTHSFTIILINLLILLIIQSFATTHSFILVHCTSLINSLAAPFGTFYVTHSFIFSIDRYLQKFPHAFPRPVYHSQASRYNYLVVNRFCRGVAHFGLSPLVTDGYPYHRMNVLPRQVTCLHNLDTDLEILRLV